jgi:hypothetical protein
VHSDVESSLEAISTIGEALKTKARKAETWLYTLSSCVDSGQTDEILY